MNPQFSWELISMLIKGCEFGYHSKQNEASYSALYDIEIPRALNKS